MRRRITQKELARMAGLSQTIVARLEAGKRGGTLATWRALAKALGVSMDALVGDQP